MAGSKLVILLSLALCLLTCRAQPLKLLGPGGFGTMLLGESDAMPKLDELKFELKQLKESLQKAEEDEKPSILQEIEQLEEEINKIVTTHKVMYNDHLEVVEDIKYGYEEKIKKLQDDLDITKYAVEKHTFDDKLELNEKSVQQFDKHLQNLDKLEVASKRILSEYEEFVHVLEEQREDLRQEKEKLLMEREDIASKLEDFKNDALSKGFTPVYT